jgi:hypothetical protein
MLKAIVNIRGKKRKNWPAVAIVGNWAATLPVNGFDLKPRDKSGWLVITHQPTGLRAFDIKAEEDVLRILKRLDKLFGNAKTKIGVMRKYNKLSKKQKDFLRGGF